MENRGTSLAIIAGVFCGLAFVAVSLRCYVRIRLVKAFGLDDYFMVAAELFHLWFTSLVLAGVYYGTGRHEYNLTLDNVVRARRMWWLCYFGYGMSMVLAKIAIGLFFLRITVTKFQLGVIWFTIGHTIIAAVIFFFVILFQCSPSSYFWTQSIPGTEGSCMSPQTFASLAYLYGSASALGDFTYGLLPIALVWHLDLNRSAKLVLAPILGMACIASCAVLVRMAYLYQLTKPDFLYSTTDTAIWSVVEPGLAITASSLATLRPLFRSLRTRFGTHQSELPMDMKDIDRDTPSPHRGIPSVPTSEQERRAKATFSQQIAAHDHAQAFEIWSAKDKSTSNTKAYPADDLESQHSGRADSDIITFVSNTRDSIPALPARSLHSPRSDVDTTDSMTLRTLVNSVPSSPMSPTFSTFSHSKACRLSMPRSSIDTSHTAYTARLQSPPPPPPPPQS